MTMSARSLAVAAVLVLGAPAVQAQEAPFLQGTFNIAIFTGSGGGNINSPNSQALTDNPLLDGTPVATLSCVGALNFGVPRSPAQPNDATIGGFLEAGSESADCEVLSSTEGFGSLTLSESGYAITTVFNITFTENAILDGLVRHDDGVGLYVNGSLVTPGATGPATVRNTPFDSPSGSYRLIYVAANGNPSILQVRGTPEEPTADFFDFGCRIDLAQTDVGPAFQFTLPASSSEKFCPDESNGFTLGLSCSGTIPDYEGPPVSGDDESGVVCRISGSQCGIDAVLTADVSSITINSEGFAELTCEASSS
jgi:hypothetical protein